MPLQKGKWSASSGAIFNLSSNRLRPLGWTSADAAGLPIYPGLIKYKEVVINVSTAHVLPMSSPCIGVSSNSRRPYSRLVHRQAVGMDIAINQ